MGGRADVTDKGVEAQFPKSGATPLLYPPRQEPAPGARKRGPVGEDIAFARLPCGVRLLRGRFAGAVLGLAPRPIPGGAK